MEFKDKILRIREEITSYEPRLCGGEHEWRIGDIQQPFQYFRSDEERRMVAAQCVCHNRKTNPMCAHFSDDYTPDPFGEQIRALVSIGILDGDEWARQCEEVHSQMRQYDEKIGAHRWDEHRDVDMPYNLRKKLQEPIFQRVQAMREALLQCIDTALKA